MFLTRQGMNLNEEVRFQRDFVGAKAEWEEAERKRIEQEKAKAAEAKKIEEERRKKEASKV